MNSKISPVSGAQAKESSHQQQAIKSNSLHPITTPTTTANEHNKNGVKKDKLEPPNKILSVHQPQQQQQKLAADIKIKNNKSAIDSSSNCNGVPIVEKVKHTQNSNHVTECDSSSSSNSNSSSISGSNIGTCNVNIKRECDENVVVKSENSTEEQNQVVALAQNTKSVEVEDENVTNENVIFAKHSAVLLTSVNPHIICFLCKGYLIDATTIVECLHSFCHSCIIKHLLNTEQFCPCCELMINTAKPNIKPDTTLQAIVYKLVPGLYERELMRKRAFYKDRPEEAALATPEQRGEDTEHLIFSPSDYMSLSLEYADIDEHVGTNSAYSELLKPRYLQCPSMYTVALLKKFVYGKFNIDINKFNIDIMFKVKTIVLHEYYTLMDVAYIYTWKRDAPMRFYFRVKESLRPVRIVRKAPAAVIAKKEVLVESVETAEPSAKPDVMTVVHAASTLVNANAELLPVTEIKVEDDTEVCQPSTSQKAKEVLSMPQLDAAASSSSWKNNKLKITLVSKSSKEKTLQAIPSLSASKSPKSPTTSVQYQSKQAKAIKDRRDSVKTDTRDERKVENIKLKIDLSKQNSVTIINMSDPQRREIVKPVKPEKEWKVKNKKDQDGSSKSSASNDSKSKTSNNLTVPPLTIKAERINPLARFTSNTQKSTSLKVTNAISPEEEETQKSQFLKSFALAPINTVKIEKPSESTTALLVTNFKRPIDSIKPIIKPSTNTGFTAPSKRKSKEPIKTIAKRPKTSPPLSNTDFKIKLPPNPNNVTRANSVLASGKDSATTTTISTTTTSTAASIATTSAASTASGTTNANDKPLMPPPTAPPSIMRPPIGLPKKSMAKTLNKFAPPGSLTPHPSYGIELAAPGNRTPIAKRYQPILPKGARPNPFANIPSEVNKILKDAGTEIKSIGNNTKSSKVYGPKLESTLMGPPPPPPPPSSSATTSSASSSSSSFTKPSQLPSQTASSPHRMNTNKSANSNKQNNTNNFLNLALFNASKSKGNEVPPGCRTPMYSPNSPIYSPSSPQYVSNYTIPTVPTYKYTPKPTNGGSNYLQNVLGSTNSQLSSLFPAPPTKKETPPSQSSSTANKSESQPKRVYPFARSPSPDEDQPENKLKVKSLLTQCNINIPSSLSITITREDSESQSNSTSYPKHKSPVNNYIEILKLPDQTPENNHENKKHSSPPAKKSSLVTLPLIKKEHCDQKSTSTSQLMTSQKGSMISTAGSANRHSSSLSNGSSSNKANAKIHNSDTQGSFSKNLSSLNNNTKSSTTDCLTTTRDITSSSNQKLMQASPNPKAHEQQKQLNKKTPSPEKRPSTSSNDAKSPKSPNSSSASDSAAPGQGSKKFRHILPRQNLTPMEVVPPKVTTANIIGTYSSPSGVAVKVHANKKVLPAKKSPSPSHQSKTHAHSSPSSSPKTPSNKTPPSLPSPGVTTTNAINKLIPHPSLATMTNLPHAMQAMAAAIPNMPSHLGVTSGSATQAEISKFLKDNLIRAQWQAAAAGQPNMFYPYASAASAAAAAQMNHFQPSMYNYQQAYIMEQLTRMQRAGNEAFTDYMSKLKNGLDKPPTEANENSKHTPKTSSSLSSSTSKGSSASKTK